MDMQVTIGNELKALGDGKVGGYLVMFSDSDTPDLEGEYFTATTDYDLDDGTGKSTVLYHHGLDPVLGKRKLGRADLKLDDEGVWMEVQLALRDAYEQMIYGMAESGKMGLSSGTAPHLVEREEQENGTNKITRWPLGLDASITPIPAEPRTSVTTLKGYLDKAEPFVKALVPEDTGNVSEQRNETEPVPEPIDKIIKPVTQESDTMTEQNGTAPAPEAPPVDVEALVAKAAQDAAEAVYKKLEAEKAINPAPLPVKPPAEVKESGKPFKSFGEQLLAIANAGKGNLDRRLLDVKAPSGLGESVGSDGGFLVQQDFATDMFSQAFGMSEIMSRCNQVTISSNANGTRIVLIDETDRGNGTRWGGVQAYWAAEAGTVDASNPTFRYVDLNLKKLFGLSYATEEVIQDATQLETVIGQAMREELIFKTEDAIINGTGAGQPLGVLNASCLIDVTKETGQAAATVVYENIVKAWSRMHPRFKQNAVWLVSPNVFPQLAQMSLDVGTGGTAVYVPSGGASATPYGTLMGRPLIEVEYTKTLGTSGDLILADFNQYYLASKGSQRADSSMHVRFIYDEMTYRFIWRLDGQPKFASALTPHNDGDTLGAFITVATRA